MDIFDVSEENPYRVELWGDEVESIRSFDILSQRSIEQLSSIRIYPASEFVLTKERIQRGFSVMEKDAARQEKIFREAFQTEEAHRIATQIKEVKEQVLEFQNYAGLEGYIRYFYKTDELKSLLGILPAGHCLFLDEPARIREHAQAIETEFRESMSHRAEKGYILPGQMQVLYGMEEVSAMMQKASFVSLSAIDLKNPLIKAKHRFDMQVRSISSYNNSFESLVKDL